MRRSLAASSFAIAGLAMACSVEEPTGPTGSGQPTMDRQPAEPTAAVVTTTTVVDQAGGVGLYTSLAIGADGRKHVTYQDDDNTRLKYATCASSCGAPSNWTKGPIDQTARVFHSSLKVNAAGRRHVTYGSTNEGGGFWYATCAPTASCTTATDWAKTRLEPSGYANGSALVLANDGRREVSYLTTGVGYRDLKFAVCLSACGQSANWTRVLVERMTFDNGTIGYNGEVTSLTIGSDGRRHIGYFNPVKRILKYATCQFNCASASSWQKLTIDQAGFVGLHASLAIGIDGVLHLSYYDYTNRDLKYARCAFDCTTAVNWRKVTVASVYDLGRHTSLAIEANGRVHVSSHHETGTALYYATCNADCTVPWNWTKAVLDGVNSSVGEYSSLAAQNGMVYITYYDRTNGNLKYLSRVPLNPF